MAKLEKEEEEAEAAMDAAMELLVSKKQKLKRIRTQRRFLKEREQKLFDKGLSDVEELERLEELEKAQEVEKVVNGITSSDALADPSLWSSETFSWLQGSGSGTPPVSQGS